MDTASPENIYDVIIVGVRLRPKAGPAGATLASRLARSAARPSVLLVEAGGDNNDKFITIDAERWIHRFNPDQNWGYQTVPQENLGGSVVSYDRGKGIGGSSSINFCIGGSSSINFCVWTWGPRDDYEEIARLVDDEEWDWEHASSQLKKLESYQGFGSDIPTGAEKYLKPLAKDHGNDGQYPLNPDLNSGNPLGLAVSPSTSHRGSRTTSSSLLVNAPPNLHILTKTHVARVLFSPEDPLKAIGIEALDGRKFLARSEVILSAGAISSPKLLLLSGIGPESEIVKHSIPVRLNLPAVGRGLKDHHHIMPVWKCAPHTTNRHTFYQSSSLQAAARAQWDTDGTGPLSEIGCVHTTGFFKSDAIYQSDEFKALPEERRRHLSQPTIPLYEILLNGAVAEQLICPRTAQPLMTIMIFVLSAEINSGTVRIGPGPGPGPSHLGDDSDDSDDDSIAVDRTFRVLGTKGLRVVDLSVLPILPHAHTQAIAYLTGAIAGDKMVREYGWDE